MSGIDSKVMNLFSYVKLEDRVPQGHPLRSIREMVDKALMRMNALFDEMYSEAANLLSK